MVALEQEAAGFKALADVTRLAVLRALQAGEMCACDLLEGLNIGQSTLSHHMGILCKAGIVKAKKAGKWTHYSLDQNGCKDLLNSAAGYLATTEASQRQSDCCAAAGASDVHAMVQEYYGKEITCSSDLKANACCCSATDISDEAKAALALLPDEIIERFYGCGSPLPPQLEGRTVLDLGCGTGRDTYIAAYLAGESGHVIGVDMTPGQLEVARRYERQMAQAFGFAKSNVTFLQGYIEDLAALGIEDNSIDVVISNCVINLAPEPQKVFDEINRVLKPGGRLYFSDVFTNRHIPQELASDPVLRGECLGGALHIAGFEQMMQQSGFDELSYVNITPITVGDKEIADKTVAFEFESRTVQAFKPAEPASCCGSAASCCS
jgi:SAM-dependent methyltransferase/DNA-binding transcriptional ArsR family regulator